MQKNCKIGCRKTGTSFTKQKTICLVVFVFKYEDGRNTDCVIIFVCTCTKTNSLPENDFCDYLSKVMGYMSFDVHILMLMIG